MVLVQNCDGLLPTKNIEPGNKQTHAARIQGESTRSWGLKNPGRSYTQMSSNYFKIWVRHPGVQPAKRLDINTFKYTIVTHSNCQHQGGKTGTLRSMIRDTSPSFADPNSWSFTTKVAWVGNFELTRFQWRNELAMHQMIRDMRFQIFVCGLSQRMFQCPKLNVILSVDDWLVYRDYRTHLTTAYYCQLGNYMLCTLPHQANKSLRQLLVVECLRHTVTWQQSASQRICEFWRKNALGKVTNQLCFNQGHFPLDRH